jgi:hypothetical protein
VNEPPQDIEAEQATLGGMMLSRDAIAEVICVLEDGDQFYHPRHEKIFNAILDLYGESQPVDMVTVAGELSRCGELQKIGGPAYLHDLTQAVPFAANAGAYAERVRDTDKLRKGERRAMKLAQLYRETRPEDLPEAERLFLADFQRETDGGRRHKGLPAPSIYEFLAGEDEPYDWLVPGLLERGDRVILTGQEGKGKSTLLRQMAVQLAAGIHPFGGPDITPLRVLLLDVENSDRQVKRKIRSLVAATGSDKLALHLVIHPAGFDLADSKDAATLEATVKAVDPDIVIGGPLYKLISEDPKNPEAAARNAASLFDRLRTEYGFALILEAHSPHASGGAKRPTRPYGASLWLRWPEFGIYLSPEGELQHWRGQRDEREWPMILQMGGAWPWTAVTRERDLLWLRIKATCVEAGARISQRDLAEILQAAKGSIQRALEEHKAEWDALRFEGNE